MYWKRFKLTPEESKYNHKYLDPRKPGQGVLSRMYPGHLELTINNRTPIFTFQVTRRAKVHALTASGDVERFQVEIITSTGEQHTAGPVYLPQLIGGYIQSPQGLIGTGLASPPNAGFTTVPYTFEPALELMSNQTLTIRGFETEDFTFDYRVDLCLHVWEYPGYAGAPH
jgi:hypothetical protein